MGENRIFETHIHLSSIDNDLELKQWISFEASFFYLNVATSLEESRIVIKQTKQFSQVFATIGLHPLYLPSFNKKDEIIEELEKLIEENKGKIVAIGECGLDFYKTKEEKDWDLQELWLREQIKLSIKYSLPLVLHLRDAYTKALEILFEYPNLRGIIHSFDGSLKEMQQFLRLKGEWFISFSPLVFRNFSKFKTLIKWIDLKKILVESDSPFLSQNQSICRPLLSLISEWKNLPLKDVKKIVFQNSLQILRLKVEKDNFKA
ncbi:TatD family hydrolase [Mycoplasma parvum]|uniref:Uncharacterized protein n=1 Tax=Mycoplasma parvum str. Indiana TaxID=1403316 RepID=U5NFT3_9MOLU|nr:TatD family hydrolase [Mycoplasma parvum]AGX89029.1 hypothetical protein PRV_01340 [Mycoplasma parvum str. Indiana]